MKNYLLKLFVLFYVSAVIVACGGGGGGGSSSGSATTVGSAPAVQTSVKNFTVDAGSYQQYATPYVQSTGSGSNAGTFGTMAASGGSSCVTASNLNFNSSSSVWYVSGTFTIKNTCATAQQVKGTIVILTGGKSTDTWNGGQFSINSFNPWLGSAPDVKTQTSSNQLSLTINNSYLLSAGNSIVASFGYSANNQPLTMSGATISIGGSVTPPPPPATATLNLTINSGALSDTCNATTSCNIPVNLVNTATNSVYKTITTITNQTGTNSYVVSNIPPASYTLVAGSLPTKVQASYVPAGGVLTLAGGQVTNATANFSVVNPGNNCLSASVGNVVNGAWWVSGTITLANACNTAQALLGNTIALTSTNANDTINQLQINSTSPYIANFASVTSTNNSSLITVNSNTSIQANGTFNINFGYSPQGTGLQGTLLSALNGATPIANSSLIVTVDSSGLVNYCTVARPCNIPIVLTGVTGQTLTTITSSTGKNIYKISNLNPGTYTLSTNNLPTDLLANYTPGPTIQLASNESAIMTVALSVKPATTGVLSFTLMNPATNLFAIESLPVTIQSNSGSNSVAINAIFSQSVSTSLVAGSYNVSVIGLGSAAQGVYYLYPVKNATVQVGQLTGLGNINAQLETNIVTESVIFNGLAKGDSATLVFTDNKHLFNREIATSVQDAVPLVVPYKFVNGDIVTINVLLNNNYQPVAPVTITIQDGQSYTISVVKKQKPAQQIVAYFETWRASATWDPATYSISRIPEYVNILPLAFAKPDSQYKAGSYKFSDAGLSIASTKDVALGAIKLAQAKGQEVLLSVGGATYPNFGAFNLQATLDLVSDLGLDGVDVDFEADPNYCSNLNTVSLSCSTDTQIINIVTQLRNGLDQLGVKLNKKMYLTAAVWSIGAYGTPQFPSTGAPAGTTRYGPYGSRTGMWVNPLKQVGNKFDALFLMSYDAGNVSSTGYSPIDAFKSYQALYSGPLYLGLEVPPEAWGGNIDTPKIALDKVNAAAALGAAGTMIWALQVQGNDGTGTVNSNNYLQPICSLYFPTATYCNDVIPMN